MTAALAIALTTAEVLTLTAAGVLVLQAAGYKCREALPVALTSALAALSFLAQCGFLVGQPSFVPALESATIVVAAGLGKRYWRNGVFLAAVRSHIRKERATWIATLPAAAYLVALAVAIPEGNYDSMRYNLARVLLFDQDGGLFPEHFSEFHQVVLPVGGDILRHFLLRFHTDFGLALFNVTALLVVAASNYSLARARASRAVSITATLIVAGAPLLIYQATGTKPDLLAAAVASTSLVVALRLYESPRALDLLLLIVFLAFGLSIKTTFLAFGLPLAVAVIVRLAATRFAWSRELRPRWRWLVLTGVIVGILSPSWLFVHNHLRWGHWAGPRDFVAQHTQADGATGAAANLVRYSVQSIHLLTPTNVIGLLVTGHDPTAVVEDFYRRALEPLLGSTGMSPLRPAEVLQIAPNRWGDGENGAWFGPLGFLVVMPSVVFAIVRGRGFVRVTAIVVVASVLLVAWFVAWMPWNGRFMALCFAGCGPCVALAVEELAFVKRLRGILRAAAWGILYYACCFNSAKDLLNAKGVVDSLRAGALVPGVLGDNIWHRTAWGQDRDYYTRTYFGDDRVKWLSEQFPPGSRVALVTGPATWVFPFLQKRPDVRFLLARAGDAWPEPVDYVLCVNVVCGREQLPSRAEILWSVSRTASRKAGALIALGRPPALLSEPGSEKN